MEQKETELQHLILLQPLPDPFVLCLVFGFRITDDLLKLGFVADGVKKRIILQIPYHPQVKYLSLIECSKILIQFLPTG